MDRPPELMSDAELVCALDQVDADLARRETYRLRVVAAMDKSGYAEEVGARDMVQYLERRYRLNHYCARRIVLLGRALPKYPAVAAALPGYADVAEGSGAGGRPEVLLRPAQADAIVSELEKVPLSVPVADVEVAEQELVRLARHLAPTDLRKAAEQSRDILDTDGPEPEEHQAAARETLTLKPVDRGVKFNGYLANENAELLRTLITAGARPHKTMDGDPDPRSREKRQADALTTTLTLAATALDAGTPSDVVSGSDVASDRGALACQLSRSGGDVVPGFGAKANITVTIDLQDLKAMTADAIGQTVYSNGLSAATIRRLACDAKVIPIVLGSNSEPLDVGRAERLVTRALRRALNTRDRGCVVCGAPPIMCDAHHLTSWVDGGDTKISNLVLLCRRHHGDLHNGHWNVTITDGEVHVARPAWADPPPRHPHKPADDASRPHEPPGEQSTCPDPSDDASRAHEPPGERPAPPEPGDDGLKSTGSPRPQTSAPAGDLSGETELPADDPWGEADVPSASAPGVRPSRWHADELTRAEATRFAVWGDGPPEYSSVQNRATNESDAGPPSFATV